ncbi:MAG: efflux RND transporter periplasmic adaptor subunit, partial [Thermoanaerobaculia bacterium]
MRKWSVRLGVAAALVAVVVVSRVTIFKPDPVAVEVAEVEVGRVEETVTNSRAGSVVARRRAKLSPEIGGQVMAIPFREGDRVRQGEVLLKIDDRSQRARLELARRELEASRAERNRTCLAAERAGRELERTLLLADEEIVSADLLDQIESAKQAAGAACQAAEATVARAQAAVSVARTELEKTEIRSPFDGVVAEVSTEIGEWATPSPPALPVPPVVDVLDPGSIYISAPMDEVDSARIRPGLEVRVTVDSHRGRSFSGRVVRVAPYVLD